MMRMMIVIRIEEREEKRNYLKVSMIVPVEEVSVALLAADEDDGEDVADLEDTAGGLVHERKVLGRTRLAPHTAHNTLHITVQCTLLLSLIIRVLHTSLYTVNTAYCTHCILHLHLHLHLHLQAVVLVLPVSEGISIVVTWYHRTADKLVE